MNIDPIYQQKKDKEEALAREYVPRENLSVGIDSLKHDLIKAIIGPRRAGKSVYCLEMLRGLDFAYVNFDDEEVLKIGSHNDIIAAIKEVYPKTKYVLLDEIQNLPKWELLANKMQRTGFNLIVTGSNANLLAGDLATHLTGRYFPIKVYPFSFREFKSLKKSADPESLLRQYLTTGGYPEVVLKGLEPRGYLNILVEAVIYRDVVKRYKVRFTKELTDMVKLLAASYTKQYSLYQIKKSLDIGSLNTINKYFQYLCQAYLFLSLDRFSFKAKEQARMAKKLYLVDTGMSQPLVFSVNPDWGKLMENAIFLELVRQGFRPNMELFYYQTRNEKEVDFVIKKGLKIDQLIQVCFDFSDPKTQKRELAALEEAGKELNCQNKKLIVLEYPKGKLDFGGVTAVSLREYLL